MGNALRGTLPRLDKELGDQRIVEMVLSVYKEIRDERALTTLIEAAVRVTLWTDEDSEILLTDPELPGSVRGILSAAKKR